MDARSDPEDVTALLLAAGNGDAEAQERLLPLVYAELHRIAQSAMRRERSGHTLQPTALVHEAYLRLVRPGGEVGTFENRRHFMATAAVAMRRILVNHARERAAQKRGGGRPSAPLDELADAFENRAIDLLTLDDALTELERRDARQSRLVQLHFFAGMTFEECAEMLGMSARQAFLEWAHARAWLRRQFSGG